MDNYIIETARLQLRPMQSADVGALHRISNEPGVRKYLFDNRPVSPACIREIFQQSVFNFESRNFGLWILREKSAPEVIGFCGLRGVKDLAETEFSMRLASRSGTSAMRLKPHALSSTMRLSASDSIV
jgi:RimJ/RimL family protein N-acetyltransferase